MQPVRSPDPEATLFADDGTLPNNSKLPFVLYRNAIDRTGTPNTETVIEGMFLEHCWGDVGRNGIYPYMHHPSMIHEVMGLARGRARVLFGGAQGRVFDLTLGVVVVLPAGTGHQSVWTSPDLVVIGAYPTNGRYD